MSLSMALRNHSLTFLMAVCLLLAGVQTSAAAPSKLILSVTSATGDEGKTRPPYPAATALGTLYTYVHQGFQTYVDATTIENYVDVLKKKPYSETTLSDDHGFRVIYSSSTLSSYLNDCLSEMTFRPKKHSYELSRLEEPWFSLFKAGVGIVRGPAPSGFDVLEFSFTNWSSGGYGTGGLIKVTFASADLSYVKNGKTLWRRHFPAGSPSRVSTADSFQEVPLNMLQFFWNEFRPKTAESFASGTAAVAE